MRLLIILILLIINMQSTSAQTYTFYMHETSGGDYAININIESNHISVSRNGSNYFSYRFYNSKIDEKGFLGFSFRSGAQPLLRPSRPNHFFIIGKNGIFCNTSDDKKAFVFKPKNNDAYLKVYQQLVNNLFGEVRTTPQQINYAMTYTFDMYETSGGDYTVAIDIRRKHITASRAGSQIFNYNYKKWDVDYVSGVIGFSFDDRYSVIMRPDHDEHYFLVRKDAIFCSTSNASQEFYFKPKNTSNYKATYQSLMNGLTNNSAPTPQQSNPSQNLTFTVDGVSFTMIYVPGGTFTMGATSEQGSDAENDEKPAHSVTLSSYHVGQTEVTQALWAAVMGSNPSRFKGDWRPVENVSWYDCQTFISRLNEKTGKNFRLPTEAEWEYTARNGNSGGLKYAGSDIISNVAWYSNNSNSSTHNVATKFPNSLGIYDMSGNVWEWCEDWYGDYNSSSQTNPKGPSNGDYRVRRGGSCVSYAGFCRVSFRAYSAPSRSDIPLGLRLAL